MKHLTETILLAVSAGLFVTMTPAEVWAQFSFESCHEDKSTITFVEVGANTKRATLKNGKCGDDCEMKDGTVTLHADGSATFTSKVMTHFTHSKDVWHLGMEFVGTAINQPGAISTSSLGWPEDVGKR